jgi:hypothetical protein
MMALHGSQKFAVLLCQFSDSQTVPSRPQNDFVDLMKRGTNGLNDFWIAASLGNINLDGSDVLGWKVLDIKKDDFIAKHPGRYDKIQGAIDAFPSLDKSKYIGYIAVFNVGVNDSSNQGNGVLAGPGDVNATFLGHETGHVFGLEHSFDQSDRKDADWSAPGEYFDSFDIMSAMNVQAVQGERFSPRGPLLNAANADRMGWLDPARVWTPGGSNSSSVNQLELVSLGHREIRGYLAAHVRGVYVEFRTKDGWDAGISRPCVLLHTMSGVNSTILASDLKNYVNDWQPGQTYGPSDLEFAVTGGVRIHIDSFDLNAKKAKITVTIRAARPIVEGPGRLLGGVAGDGGGWVILPSGKVIKIPPRSPVLDPIQRLSVALEAEHHLQGEHATDVRRAVFRDLVSHLQRDLGGHVG